MSWLSPCSSPAWQAPVCDDQSVSHSANRWESSRNQRAMVGTLPSRSARRTTSWASPSISRKTMPGTSLSIRAPRRRAWPRTTLRYQDSSSSTASSAFISAVNAARPSATRIPSRSPSMFAPGIASIAKVTSTPLRISEASPRVRTFSGSAKRTSSGQTRAFSTPTRAAAPSAAAGPSKVRPGSTAESRSNRPASSRSTRATRRRRCPTALSLALAGRCCLTRGG